MGIDPINLRSEGLAGRAPTFHRAAQALRAERIAEQEIEAARLGDCWTWAIQHPRYGFWERLEYYFIEHDRPGRALFAQRWPEEGEDWEGTALLHFAKLVRDTSQDYTVSQGGFAFVAKSSPFSIRRWAALVRMWDWVTEDVSSFEQDDDECIEWVRDVYRLGRGKFE